MPQTATMSPQDLVSPETFETLVSYTERHQRVTRAYAERGVEQMLVFLKACADNPGEELSPTVAVDPFWHAFQLHSRPYEQFEKEHAAGRRLRHDPTPPEAYDEEASIRAVERTVGYLTATGLPVDMDFWSGHATCGQGNSP